MVFLKQPYKLLLFTASIVILSIGCKKTINNGGEKVGGCTDFDSPIFDSISDYDDASCLYAYIKQYEITYYPEKNSDNENWDYDPFQLSGVYPADLILYIQEDIDTFFYSHSIDNQPHNSPCFWTAPENKKLFNKKYHWELYDDDGLTSYDFIDSGSFNPITNSINGKITTFGKHPPANKTQLILHYELYP